MKINGVDWDEGNWPKCGKHGVSKYEIEQVLRNAQFRIRDPNPNEARFRTAGKSALGRHVFIVFTYRERNGLHFIRPISARFMHKKEIERLEQRHT